MPGGTLEERFQNDRTPEAEISPTHPRPSRDVLAALRQNLLVAGSYWALAALVKWFFSRYQMWPAPLWLPAGVALFAALALPRRSWPGIFCGSLVTNIFSFNEPPAWAAVTALGNTIAPVVVAGLLRRGILARELFYRTSNAIIMVLATLLDGAIGAAFGGTVVWAQSSAGLDTLPSKWWRGPCPMPLLRCF
jgi:two-component system, cell cycle sensor histidine kinase PleC